MQSSASIFIQPEIENIGFSTQISILAEYAGAHGLQMYIIHSPLSEEKYKYEYQEGFVVMIPKRKILFVNTGHDNEAFETYRNDFIEDLASLSDKYQYKSEIGRPRSWQSLIQSCNWSENSIIDELAIISLIDKNEARIAELLISLIAGSINDISRVKAELPASTLDRVKQKIVLFDGEQTRFIYQKTEKKRVVIQGLSGTGKTELLLHKLRELFVRNTSARILFTCHNRILSSSMRRRIPDFFNFMKVEQQILWNERFWCIHAWGSESDINSGTYRYICAYYGLTFFRWSKTMSFDKACKMAIEELKLRNPQEKLTYAFDYALLDESQDFPDSFLELCEMVTKEQTYIAGDIFQSIFEIEKIGEVAPDFLLNKCYRTDPKTLMFAHALGLGLFEPIKLRWLNDDEWTYCGYKYLKLENGKRFRFSREPLRRFEDIDEKGLSSVEILTTSDDVRFIDGTISHVINLIQEIKTSNPTIHPDDIAVIFTDYSNESYAIADMLIPAIYQNFEWHVNQAYTSKEKTPGRLFVSNVNNVKGLEFPFVICVTRKIHDRASYRNSLYMALTRSFIKSVLILKGDLNAGILGYINVGLREITTDGVMTIDRPNETSTVFGKSTIRPTPKSQSLREASNEILDDLEIDGPVRKKIFEMITQVFEEDYDFDNLGEFIVMNQKFIESKSK
jgi:superfamily I DNA and RNA helicase